MAKIKMTPRTYAGMEVEMVEDYSATMGRTIPAGTKGVVVMSRKMSRGWHHMVRFEDGLPVAVPVDKLRISGY